MSEKKKKKKHRQSQGRYTSVRAQAGQQDRGERYGYHKKKKKKKVIREKYAGMISIRIYICFGCRVFAVGFLFA